MFDQKAEKYEAITEIDVRKAYTHAFNQVTDIPVFNQFHKWKHFNYKAHNYTKFRELTVFMVKPKEQVLFFNKAHCLTYAKVFKALPRQMRNPML